MSLPPQVRRIPPPSSYHQTQLSPFLLFPFPFPSWCIIPRTAKTAGSGAGRRRKKRKSQAHKQQEGGRERQDKNFDSLPPPPSSQGRAVEAICAFLSSILGTRRRPFRHGGKGRGRDSTIEHIYTWHFSCMTLLKRIWVFISFV